MTALTSFQLLQHTANSKLYQHKCHSIYRHSLALGTPVALLLLHIINNNLPGNSLDSQLMPSANIYQSTKNSSNNNGSFAQIEKNIRLTAIVIVTTKEIMENENGDLSEDYLHSQSYWHMGISM